MSQVESQSRPEYNELIKENNEFRLPVTFVKHKQLSDNVINDLELMKFKDNEKSNFYNAIFEPTTLYGKQMASKWARDYTEDKTFLKESQYLYKNYDASMNIYNKDKLEKIQEIWKDIKNDNDFINKFHYVEYEFAQQLNESASFLQILTMYNLLFSCIFHIITNNIHYNAICFPYSVVGSNIAL